MMSTTVLETCSGV